MAAAASMDEIRSFLAEKRIAIAGVSTNPKHFSARLLADFRKAGYDTIPVNPKAQEIGGLRCYECVQEIQPAPGAVLIMTRPDASATVANDSYEAGVKKVWFYRAVGQGAVNPAAVEFCRRSGMQVIAGLCPYMFLNNRGFPHNLHGWLMQIRGTYPA